MNQHACAKDRCHATSRRLPPAWSYLFNAWLAIAETLRGRGRISLYKDMTIHRRAEAPGQVVRADAGLEETERVPRGCAPGAPLVRGRANSRENAVDAMEEALLCCAARLNDGLAGQADVDLVDLIALLDTLRDLLVPRVLRAGVAMRWERCRLPARAPIARHAVPHVLQILRVAFTSVFLQTRMDQISVFSHLALGGVHVSIAGNRSGPDCPGPVPHDISGLLRQALAIGANMNWHRDEQGMCFNLLMPTDGRCPTVPESPRA